MCDGLLGVISSLKGYMKENRKGFIQIYTGKGKGKTTAALGLAVRARGAGLKVAIVYFDKGGTHYSERKLFKKLGIDYVASGLDRIDAKGRFRFGVTPADIKEAKRGLKAAEKFLVSKKYDLVVLDEINSTTDLKMLKAVEVLKVISRYSSITERKVSGMPASSRQKIPEKTELVLTGRNAPKEFLDIANLITEMKLVKHYFYRGARAREGIDF